MSLFTSLYRRYQDSGPRRFSECRRCSVAVENEVETCPQCGTPSIATYEL